MRTEEYRRQMDRIIPDEGLVARTQAAMRRRKAQSGTHRRPLRIILAAALAMTLLTAIAFASGLMESVFLQIKGLYAREDVDFELISRDSAKDVFKREIILPGTDVPMTFSVRESYFDGESLMLGTIYTIPHRPARFDFDPDHPNFSHLEEMGTLDYDIRDDLTAEEYQRYEAERKAHGKVGIILYQTYMSDGVFGDQGEALPMSKDARGETDDGATWRMIELESPLPDALRNQDAVTIGFHVVQAPVYYYEDERGSSIYFAFPEREVVPLFARIERSAADARHLEGAFTNETYAVRVDALVAPAYIKASFALDVSDEWRDEAFKQPFFLTGESPVDFVCGFIMVGDRIAADTQTDFVSGDLAEMRGTFPPLPSGADNLVFRPVYVNSGPHPDEDIVIRLAP